MCIYNVTIILLILSIINLTINTILFDSKTSVNENKCLLDVDGNFILRVHIVCVICRSSIELYVPDEQLG